MERVAFLIEETGERVGCLLNPESVVVRREAGLRRRASSVGRLTGRGLADDALLYTGGGRTELDLDLLFDVSLAGSSIQTDDVRDLTAPLWRLAEVSQDDSDGRGRPPLVRFVWGKAWNVPGLIAAVAERLERFSPGGVPGRSWLRLRLLRVVAPPPEDPLFSEAPPSATALAAEAPAAGEARFHRLVGDGGDGGESLDQLAQRYYGHPAFWRLLARANAEIENPLDPPANLLLRIPAAPEGGA